MPLEIRELIIRTQIVTEEPSATQQNQGQREVDIKLIADQCVEKILKILKKKMDR